MRRGETVQTVHYDPFTFRRPAGHNARPGEWEVHHYTEGFLGNIWPRTSMAWVGDSLDRAYQTRQEAAFALLEER